MIERPWGLSYGEGLEKKKYAIYCRVSTQEQTTENQKIRLVDYANKHNWDYEVFVETESSRKTRPVKAKLLQQLRHKMFEGVLVWKLDRWARSSYELLTEITELYEKDIKFISLSDNIDMSTATGRLHFQILSSFAEFERNLIRERTMEGLNRALRQGKKLGRPTGSKDKKVRKKGGYYMRYMTKQTPDCLESGLFIKEATKNTGGDFL